MARQIIASASLKVPLQVQIGNLSAALTRATVAISKTGTVTMECACFWQLTVTLYQSFLGHVSNRQAHRERSNRSGPCPTLLAGDAVFPEFIQDEATPENISRAALELLRDQPRREKVQARLREIASARWPWREPPRRQKPFLKSIAVSLLFGPRSNCN